MTSPRPEAHLPLCRLAIDDLGEFLLVVVDGERGEEDLPVAQGSLHYEEHFQAGPVWTRRSGNHTVTLGRTPSGSTQGPGAGPWQGRYERPAQASACAVFRPETPQGWPEEGLLLMPLGPSGWLPLGMERLGWPIDGLEHAIELCAEPDGLQIVCLGGVRVAKGDGGDFDASVPRRLVAWPTQETLLVWCQARRGAPLMLTLELWRPGLSGPTQSAQGAN
ncbi:MAG: hypothetical protein H6830_09880 [Planctomycetes bacterium]|nr:hypothetical protein [Planctomycetota bacterium]MCB9909422.1 hypothetical protein [Planctomycetota bacterium]HPF15065.1 hypothetical protein [Planctomycetota bacterium]